MSRFLKFSLTGIAGTILDLAVFTFVLYLSDNSTLSRSAGYLFGTMWAFMLNRSWVFKSSSDFTRLIHFSLLYLTSGLLAVAIQWGFGLINSQSLGIPIGYALGLMVASTINFLGMKYLVFRSHVTNSD